MVFLCFFIVWSWLFFFITAVCVNVYEWAINYQVHFLLWSQEGRKETASSLFGGCVVVVSILKRIFFLHFMSGGCKGFYLGWSRRNTRWESISTSWCRDQHGALLLGVFGRRINTFVWTLCCRSGMFCLFSNQCFSLYSCKLK